MNKKSKIISWFWSFAVLLLFICLKPSHVSAETAYGAQMDYTYFQDIYQAENTELYNFPPTQNVPYGGLTQNPGTLNAQQFLSMMQARLFDSSSVVDQGAAAAVVDVMLGKTSQNFGGSYQNGITYAQNNFQSFVYLVNFYDQQEAPGYSIEWNRYSTALALPDGNDNSSIALNGNTELPDVFFFDDAYTNFSDYMVVFHFPGGGEFILQQRCANFIGPFTAPTIPPSYSISGDVFTDTNADGTENNSETNYTGGITITGSGGTVSTNASNGTYTISGLYPGTYTVTYTSLPSGYYMTYPGNSPPSFTITVGTNCSTNGANNASCNGGNIQNLNFGIHPLYTISGNVFLDSNKNGILDSGESDYQGSISVSISPNAGTITTNSNGTYTITHLPAGIYTVSYQSLPAGYQVTSPLTGPPPSFTVTVGPGCNINNAPGAQCQ